MITRHASAGRANGSTGRHSACRQHRAGAIHYASVLLLTQLWCWQGLVPKLVYPEGGELALLQAAGLFPGWERTALTLLGFAEIGIGLMTAACHRKTWMWRGQAVLVLLLACAALGGYPEWIKAPFSPVTLSAAMIGLGIIAAVSEWRAAHPLGRSAFL
ncbi:DoxX-like family protein [Paenibacillus melissococcoides]|uniref:DoxX-like family protein n=1 Tax=Paenibacillus melissococcoides TaxID=2912268 RepID=A0ABM9G4N6_9BACL|nr:MULTISPECIES: DoxX-like family protein [Paenibacillus]MEB9892140.1 DoxX-like family protein [Bacillus cereus]CAH8246751.1 DoxX-like family protein [Paenibacillus melissococcoides]CAH8715646.1 DoxX-like family protein [Paenibacillus melissococcoides]CAH8716604.1 DoxX-like family protein [Paenibacillus melissococcoides]GIO77069.1 hypothetical protein J6TS7_06790 [Paenibacillus dendritiformis]